MGGKKGIWNIWTTDGTKTVEASYFKYVLPHYPVNDNEWLEFWHVDSTGEKERVASFPREKVLGVCEDYYIY